jgi:hypothetical protein
MKGNRKLKLFAQSILVVLLPFIVALSAFGESEIDHYREYRFLFGPTDEVKILATAGVSLNKAFQDIYFRKLESLIPRKIEPVTEIVWSAYWSFFFSLWPHEFGHRARARQVGGDFIIKGFGFPFPSAEMDLPEDLEPGDAGLPIVGGFEVNSLMKRQIHTDFYYKGFGYADELVHSFIQEVYFPFYAFVIIPADPEDPETWTDTRGDPVESVLTIYKSHTGKPPIGEDGSVDPDLIRNYRETIYLSLLWTLLDPMIYQSAKGFAVDMNKDHGLMTPWMLGNERNAWSYGTQFHQSPLGYELYITNYLRLRGKLYTLYVKGGRPYKNLGIGINIPGLIEREKFTLGVACDFWDQDIYGSGAALSFDMEYRFYEGLGFILNAIWKDRGYLIGERTGKTPVFLAGLSYQF